MITRCVIRRPLIPATACSLFLLGGGALVDGCASKSRIDASGVVAPAASDIVISREQFGTTVTVKVGDTVAIEWANPENWHIDFGSPPLRLIDPRPGQSGWRFRAIAAGDTDVTLTLVTTGDAPPPRQSVSIRVTG